MVNVIGLVAATSGNVQVFKWLGPLEQLLY
jgi:hypothetical protein